MLRNHHTQYNTSFRYFPIHSQKFRSAGQKFGCPNPHHFLVGLIKNEGQPDENFGQPNQITIWFFQPSQKVESAYKISMDAYCIIRVAVKKKKNFSKYCVSAILGPTGLKGRNTREHPSSKQLFAAPKSHRSHSKIFSLDVISRIINLLILYKSVLNVLITWWGNYKLNHNK